MITGFRHKGLEDFYRPGTTKGIQAAHANKLQYILGLLDVAVGPEDMSVPSFKLHSLKGDQKEHWSIWANGNWRVTFRFAGSDVERVDYQDYH